MHTFVHKAWMRIICIYLSVLYVEIGYVRIQAYSLRSAFVTAAGTDAAGTLGLLSLFRKYRYAIFPT